MVETDYFLQVILIFAFRKKYFISIILFLNESLMNDAVARSMSLTVSAMVPVQIPWHGWDKCLPIRGLLRVFFKLSWIPRKRPPTILTSEEAYLVVSYGSIKVCNAKWSKISFESVVKRQRLSVQLIEKISSWQLIYILLWIYHACYVQMRLACLVMLQHDLECSIIRHGNNVYSLNSY